MAAVHRNTEAFSATTTRKISMGTFSATKLQNKTQDDDKKYVFHSFAIIIIVTATTTIMTTMPKPSIYAQLYAKRLGAAQTCAWCHRIFSSFLFKGITCADLHLKSTLLTIHTVTLSVRRPFSQPLHV